MKTGWILAGTLAAALAVNRNNPSVIRTIWSLLPHPKKNNAISDVKDFDVNAYMGKWYQIYRTPNSFQSDNATQTTAEYALQENGTISVVNTETVDEKDKQGVGFAIPEVSGDVTKLLVSFFPPFAGSYQILSLGPKQNGQYPYVLVGSPYSNNMWILAREPSLDPQIVQSLQEKATRMGITIS